MIQYLRVVAISLAMRYRGILTRIATPIAIVLYPSFQLLNFLHRLGAVHFGLRRFKSAAPGIWFDPLGGHIRYEGVKVGANAFLGPGARIWAMKEVRIGNDVMFGPDVFIMDGFHRVDVVGKTIRDSGPDERQPVTIGDDVWVGARSTIMRGVCVGQGSVVGAESLVTKSLPPYVVAGGNPCRIIRKRFSDVELSEHLRLLGVSLTCVAELVHERATALDEVCSCDVCRARVAEELRHAQRERGGSS